MTSVATPGKRSARDRLLETADRLFDAEGTDAVGIDRILEESGVAKGSLYYNFSGKAELVTEYYLRQHARWVRPPATPSPTIVIQHQRRLHSGQEEAPTTAAAETAHPCRKTAGRVCGRHVCVPGTGQG